MRGLWSDALAFALLLALSPCGLCQSPESQTGQTPRLVPRTHEEREQRFVTQHRVILNVEVYDATGRPVTDLEQADFSVVDNNQPRKLAAFSQKTGASAGAAPPHVILVLDTVNSYSKMLRSFERQVEAFLKHGEGRLPYPVSIGLFSGASIELGKSSREREALLAELRARTSDLRATGCIIEQDQAGGTPDRSLAGAAAGGFRAESVQMLSCLNQRFISSVMALRQLAQDQVNVPGRVILIWIGPGWPLLTNRAFTPDSPEVKESFFDQLVLLSMELTEAQITVNAVASPDDLPYPGAPRDRTFFDGVASSDQVKAGNLGLHALAHQTGGHIDVDARGMEQQIEACMADAESYYVLSFDPPPAAQFGEYHSLTVKVDKPGLDLRTNTFFYAEQ